MISNDGLIGNRAPVQHQLRSLIGLGYVTAGNPGSSRIVIAIVWLKMPLAISFRDLQLAYRKFAIVWQALCPHLL